MDRRAGDQQRERRQAGERRRLAAVGEALGADEILRHRAQDQRKGIDDQIGVPRDDHRVDERLARQVARRVWRDGEGDDRQDQRDPDRRDAGARPFARPDKPLALAIEETETRRARALRHQSLSSSLMPVLARVFASTVLTITAQ